MLQPQPYNSDADDSNGQPQTSFIYRGGGSVNIQKELNRLEEMIYNSVRIPLTRRTLVDEEEFLEQLDLVRLNLPKAFEEAIAIISERDELLLQTEDYCHDLLDEAQRTATRLVHESEIIQQAELEARHIRQRVQQECEELRQSTLVEIERMRQQSLEEVKQLREMALSESEEIQNGADDYADAVLTNIEQQLTDMLRVIRNGRQQLETEAQEQRYSRADYADFPPET